MKRLFNPLIERVGCGVAQVDQYADIFERLALGPTSPSLVRALFAHKVPDDVRASPILFIHVPKNGGTSVKRSLYVSDPGHATARFYEMLAPELLAARATLALLRDPFERFLSSFDFLRDGGGANVRILPRPLGRLRHIGRIDQLLDHLEAIDGDWLKVDAFLRPQRWFLTGRAGDVRVANLFVLDGDNRALDAFLARFGQPPVQHLNATARRSHGLSDAQARRVRALYARDFALVAAAGARGGGPAAPVAPVATAGVAKSARSV